MVLLKKTLYTALFFMLQFSVAAQDELMQAFKDSYAAEKGREYKKGITVLQSVYDKDSYELNLRLGWLYYLSGQLDESVQYYQKSIALKPYAIEPKFGLAYPLWAQAKWNELLTLYGRILETDPKNSFANYRTGLIYYNKGQYETAGPYFEKVVNLYPFDYSSLLLLAWNNLKLQKTKDAKVLFQKVLLNNPGDSSALEGLKLIK